MIASVLFKRRFYEHKKLSSKNSKNSKIASDSTNDYIIGRLKNQIGQVKIANELGLSQPNVSRRIKKMQERRVFFLTQEDVADQ